MKYMHAVNYVKHCCIYWPVLMCWLCWLCCPCWLCWLAFGCIAPCGWAGCCGAPGGVGCWTWGCWWAPPWGGMTPVAVKNWLMEVHRSAIWAASNDQLLSSACRMLSFRPGRQTEETFEISKFYCLITSPAISACYNCSLQSYMALMFNVKFYSK